MRTYVERWHLTIGPTHSPGGDASWSAPAVREDGTRAALKIAIPPDLDGANAATLLQILAGDGAVQLLEYDAANEASLMELCDPGTVAASLPAAQADLVAIEVLPKIWNATSAAAPTDLPRVADIVADRVRLLRDRAERLDDPLLREGADVFADLADSTGSGCLLHGDFNQRNVLLARRGWLAIDPRPTWGDPSYDVAQGELLSAI